MSVLATAAASGGAELTGLTGWVVSVIESIGPVGVGLLVALENAFPPIPSEVVLPVAGYVASTGQMSLAWAIVGATLGSLAGAWLLYGIGRGVGVARLRRWIDRMPLVDVEDLERSEAWFRHWGVWAVLVGRCVPVVRSLVSLPAGLERMGWLAFTLLTALGSTVWNAGLIVAGYALGSQWQDVGHYSDYINYAVYAAIVFFVGKFVWTRVRRSRRQRAEAGRDRAHA
ncbi:DedA family protein [Cellulomonas marina]|uniref:Membrane protein DedA, SNARE-associated domain n=1 Tax=Cellulomonas marina TaxID=988821 RepID=A0A1I0Z1K0_9CELL|nr:DedA family protein [Cellulomonas marina]GIG28109.1 membrane protein [Cellulomonas marina]SFB18318.1 membrane protein DedA, SNARE-associated domain [Cellulomonas marina]